MADRVDGFVRDATRHPAVADDRHDPEVVATKIARHGHAESSPQRRGGVRHAKRVVGALAAHREAGEPVFLANGVKTVAASRDQLVPVRLMPDVPDDLIGRRIENAMHGESQLDGAQARTQVTALLADDGDDLLADFIRKLLELRQRKRFQIARAVDGVQNSMGQRVSFGVRRRAVQPPTSFPASKATPRTRPTGTTHQHTQREFRVRAGAHEVRPIIGSRPNRVKRRRCS